MLIKDKPIKIKLMRIIVLNSGIVVLLACSIFFVYEFFSFRQNTVQKLETIGKIISSNSTAALAFENAKDASEILSALKAEPHIVIAALYTADGNFFSRYPLVLNENELPETLKPPGFYYTHSHIEEIQHIFEGKRKLGTLYLKSDINSLYKRMEIYAVVSSIVILLSIVLSYLLSKILQKSVSDPILALAETAQIITDQKNYTLRAIKLGNDELGLLTDAFNQMLNQIQLQNKTLKDFNKSLEKNIKERTKELQRSNAELEQFAYVASHDLQEPLRTVTSYVQLLERRYKDKLDDDANDFIAFAVDGSNRMRVLIQSLLEYSRVNSKRPFEELDLNVFMKTILINLNESIKENNVKINVNPLPKIFGDPILMNQLFQNLLSNAIKFKGEVPPEIAISCEKKEDKFLFSIKDNGIGIEKEYHDKIFVIFQRLQDKGKYSGTGIGLAICKKIVERHGGKIWVESELGKGTTFYFTIKNSN